MKLTAWVLVILFAAGSCGADLRVQLQHASFDPPDGVPSSISAQEKSDPGQDGSRYYIVQFTGPIKEEWKTAAKAAGAEILDYIPDFAFIVRAAPQAETALRALKSIRWVGDFAPAYRLSPKLPKGGTAEVVIRAFSSAEAGSIARRVVDAGGRVLTPRDENLPVIRALLPSIVLSRIARTAGVASVEPWVAPKLLNNTARGIMAVSETWTDMGFFGSGQILAVADTGLDNGSNDATLSADFRDRLLKAYSLGRRNDWSDPNGHGTHVCGSVLGNGRLSGANPDTHAYAGSFAGAAPESMLIFQSIMDKSGNLRGIPSDLNQLFLPPYQDGARVHSNSWGSAVNGSYGTDSYNTDLFTWNHKDMVICFAAGNEGVDNNPADGLTDPDSIDSPGTAKNCITVGATESNTTLGVNGTWGDYWLSDFPSDPIKSDRISNNPNGMAAWSSRGPADDGRIKPDICAPGTNIISCRSHVSGAGTLWGVYNSDYVFSGGTSMATPLVAGACGLVRESYLKQGVANPSSALVKATLINGARDLTPGQYMSSLEIPQRPNTVEGWGRLDLKNSLSPSSQKLIYRYDASTGLSTGSTDTYNFYVLSGSVPFRATLVWTDYPGSTTALFKLVNDLDLKITGPTGGIYRGNGTTDRRNNVEGIDVASPAPGLYRIEVNAYNVPQGPQQPYALVISGAATTLQPTPVSTAAAAKQVPDGSLVSLTGKVVTAGSDLMKHCIYVEESNRASGIRVQLSPSDSTTITAGTTVNVTGKLTTINGERAIVEPIVTGN